MANVTPDEFKALIPDPSAKICGNFINSLLKLPVKVWQLATYLLDSSGNLNQALITKSRLPGEFIFHAVLLDESANGVLLCDGREVARVDYPELFTAISTTFGTPSGSTVFKLPDFKDRFPIGKSSTKAVGSTGGEATHVLTVGEMPSHTHGVTAMGGGGSGADSVGHTNDDVTPFTDVEQTSAAGGGAAHNNVPPYLTTYIFIKT